MKKFIFIMIAMFTMAISANAQTQSNYAGSSKFTDNWSVTLQGGVLTTLDDFFAGYTATAPVVVLGADKYFTPWLGVGVEGRTLIGTGNGKYNTHTAFDAVNVNGYVKFNVLNAIKFDGNRRFFEPVVYTGLGWGHQTCSDYQNIAVGTHTTAARNYMTYRVGAELNFNLGKQKAWAVVVNPSVVWGNICNGKLVKQNGNFELTAGIVYHFKTSNGTHHYTKARLYDQAEVDALNAKIAELESRPAQVVEKVVEVAPKTDATAVAQTVWTVMFSHDSSELTETAKTVLDGIGQNSIVVVDGYASKEPKSNPKYNDRLSAARAQTVADYLTGRGVKVESVIAHGCNDEFGRVVVVTTAK